jgi:hypothetical protein
MPVVAVCGGLSEDQYEPSVREVTGGGKDCVESPSDWPVPGLLAHIARQGVTGFAGCRRLGVRGGVRSLRRDADVDPAGFQSRGRSRRSIRHTPLCQPGAGGNTGWLCQLIGVQQSAGPLPSNARAVSTCLSRMPRSNM